MTKTLTFRALDMSVGFGRVTSDFFPFNVLSYGCRSWSGPERSVTRRVKVIGGSSKVQASHERSFGCQLAILC